MTKMDAESAGPDTLSLGDEIVSRINQLAAISETPAHLARIFLTREHRAAAELLLSWMRSAPVAAHLGPIGHVCGRYEGARPVLPCLMLGSHYDTVRDAGEWDRPPGPRIARLHRTAHRAGASTGSREPAGRGRDCKRRRDTACGETDGHGRPCRYRADAVTARRAGGCRRVHRCDRGILPDRRRRTGRHRRLYPCDAGCYQCHSGTGVVHD